MATGNHIEIIHAAQGALYYDVNGTAINFSTALNGLVTAPEQVITLKDLTITLPKTEVDQVPLLGVESTTAGAGVMNTGTFQNAIHDFKNTTDAEMSGTMLFTMANDGSSPVLPDFINLATGVGLAVSSTHHRHSFGDSTTAQTQDTDGVIFVIFDTNVTGGTAGMLNAVVNLGDIKTTGGDGHWELDFTAKSLPKNFALEVEDLD